MYKRVDQEGEDKDSILDELAEKGTSLDLDLFGSLEGDDFFPVHTEEDIIHLLTEYFDKRTDLTGDAVIDTFVKNVNVPKKWVVEDVVAAFQEMENVQVVPLVKDKSRVEDFAVSDVIPKEQLLPTTKMIFAAYQKLTHFQLIVRESDKKGMFLSSELPAVLQKKVTENPALATLLAAKDKGSDVSTPARSVAPVAASLAAEPPVPPKADLPPNAELDQGVVDEPKGKTKAKPRAKKADKVPVSQVEVLQLKTSTEEGKGTRKITEGDALPEITPEELAEIKKQTSLPKMYSYAVEQTEWGKYLVKKGYRQYSAIPKDIQPKEKLFELLSTKSEDPTLFFKPIPKSKTEKKKD